MRQSGRRQIERLVWWAPTGQPWKVLSFIADHIPLGRPTSKELSATKTVLLTVTKSGGGGVTPNPWGQHREAAGSVGRQREGEKPLLYFSWGGMGEAE